MFRMFSKLQMNKYDVNGSKNENKSGRLKVVCNFVKKLQSISLLVLR